MTDEKFDVIVVGAGPAGISCSLTLAKNRISVLLIERGKFPGSKNVWGGAFYGEELKRIIPDFPSDAPVERPVTRRKISFLNESSCLSLEFSSSDFSGSSSCGWILLRSKFDRWLASRAEEAGATIACGLKVDDLIFNRKRVVGVRAGGDNIEAEVVVACDGVNSLIAQKAGLSRNMQAKNVKLGVKEVIEIPSQEIQKRFGIGEQEGVAWEMIGCTDGLPGGGFIYTNRESISIGIVTSIEGLSGKCIHPYELLEKFKKHPVICGLIDGGKVVEYSAHLLPVGGIDRIPKLYGDGILLAGDAGGLVLSAGFILEGANFAVSSGIAAAETIIEAKKSGDFSSGMLRKYADRLNDSFVLGELKKWKRAPEFLENPRIYSLYPSIFCEMAQKLLTGKPENRDRLWNSFKKTAKNRISSWTVLKDIIKLKNSL